MPSAVRWAADNGMDAVSISMAYDWNNSSMREASAYASSKGVVLMAAAGNDAFQGLTNPARKPEFISVGAGYTNLQNGTYQRAMYSSVGEELEYMALTGRFVRGINGTLKQYTGTSCACPVFAGMYALYAERFGKPSSTDEYRSIVQKHCMDMHTPGRDNETGYGFYKLPSLNIHGPLKEIMLFVDRSLASVDGKRVQLDQPPVIAPATGRTLVPLAFIGRQLGHRVDWNNDARTVTIDGRIVLTIDIDVVQVNGRSVRIDQPAVIQSSRTLVPLSFIARELGYDVYWNDIARCIVITR